MSTVAFSQLPNLGNLTANTIIPVVSANVNYTVTAATIQNYVNGANGNILTNNLTAAGVVQASTLSATGNVNCGNLNLTGNIVDPASTLQIRSGGNIELVPTTQVNVLGPFSATGNVSGNYLLANIFFATGYNSNKIYNGTSEIAIGASNGPANITIGGVANVAVFSTTGLTATNLSATGNVTAVNTVQAPILSATANVVSGNINLSGNIVDSNALTIQAGGNITLSPTGQTNVTGTLSVPGTINAGNVNANVFAVTTISATNISASGNITGGTLIGAVQAANIVQIPTTSTATLATLVGYTERTEDLGSLSGSFTPNYNNGIVQLYRVTGNFTLNPPINMVPGRSLTLILTQDGVGNRQMTANVVYKFAYGIKSLSTAANATDMLSIFATQNANAAFMCNLVRDYK